MNNIKRSHPAPSADDQVPPKHRKISMNTSSILSSSNTDSVAERECQLRDIAALDNWILQTTADELHKIKVRIGEMLSEEKITLKKYMETNKKILERFERAQGPSMSSLRENSRAEISQIIKEKISRKIANLLTKKSRMNHSSHEDFPTFLQTQENGIETHEESSNAEMKPGFSISHILKEKWIPQRSNCDELAEPSVKIQRFYSERLVHANKLQEKPQTAKDCILTLRETSSSNLVLGNPVVGIQEGLEDAGEVGGSIFIPHQSDASFSSLYCDESMDSDTCSKSVATERSCLSLIPIVSMREYGMARPRGPGSLDDSPDATSNEDSSSEALNEGHALQFANFFDLEPQDLLIKVSNYHVRVSDSRFFNIRFEAFYTNHQGPGYYCKKCTKITNTRIKMEDHIFAAHNGGRFACPYCFGASRMTRRHQIGEHIRRYHSEVIKKNSTSSGFSLF